MTVSSPQFTSHADTVTEEGRASHHVTTIPRRQFRQRIYS